MSNGKKWKGWKKSYKQSHHYGWRFHPMGRYHNKKKWFFRNKKWFKELTGRMAMGRPVAIVLWDWD